MRYYSRRSDKIHFDGESISNSYFKYANDREKLIKQRDFLYHSPDLFNEQKLLDYPDKEAGKKIGKDSLAFEYPRVSNERVLYHNPGNDSSGRRKTTRDLLVSFPLLLHLLRSLQLQTFPF